MDTGFGSEKPWPLAYSPTAATKYIMGGNHMLLVKTKIKEGSIAGIGLFANQFIPKGTPVWKFQEGFDLTLSKAQFAGLSLPAQEQVLNYCYFNPKTDRYVVCSDDARFFNHSDDPNVSSGPDDDHLDAALRDIEIGEELTQNYKNFDGNVGEKLHPEIER